MRTGDLTPSLRQPHPIDELPISRRRLLWQGAAGLGLLATHRLNVLCAQEKAAVEHPRLKITDIEVHSIQVPYHDWAAYEMNHYSGPTRRTIYVLHTNTGLTGLGETDEPMTEQQLQPYLGTSPFDWLGDDGAGLGFQAGLYDLMGQAAGLPVHRLFGPRQRAWVSIAAWTVATHPPRMAKTVSQLASMGYRWMKYHLSPFENIIDQLEAMQQVAPRGFKLHFDHTRGGTDDHVFELLEKISRFPIAGCFEDPMVSADLLGYADLRAKCRLPILYHHSPLGSGPETQFRAVDGYILGAGPIGYQIRHAGLFQLLNIPFSMQCPGGMILRAMAIHLHAAFKAATQHFNTDTETWKMDVTHENLEPIHGWIRVPQKPGLGVTLDREKLETLKNLKLPEQPDWIIKTRFANGTMMYNRASTSEPIYMVRPDTRGEITLGYDMPVTTEWWDPDGTPAFRSMMDRLVNQGMVLERSG